MNSDLYFEGKKYISSSRAAKISGYVNDYIGQLCRDGKLESRMVGRSWYVSLESLINHKNTYGLTTKSKRSKKVENVTYLSALTSPSVTPPTPPTASPSKEDGEILIAEPRLDTAPLVTSTVAPVTTVALATPTPVHAEVIAKLPSKKFNFLKIAGAVAILAVLVAGFRIGMVVNPDAGAWYSTEFAHTESSLQANVLSVVEQLWNGTALAFYNDVRNLFDHSSSVLVSNDSSGVSEEQSSGDTTGLAEPSGTSEGLVVVPTNAGTDRAGVIAKIKNSFSDDVVVKPGDSQSGVITPVFKNSTSNDYLYVLVPVSGEH